jgi:hypothetical protein
MQLTSLALTEAAAKLEDFAVACSKKPLHVKLRRSGKKPVAYGKRVNVAFRSHRGHEERCLHFEETLASKEGTNNIADSCTAFEIGL